MELYCSKCKTSKGKFVKNTKKKYKDKIRQYYLCNECNTKRHNLYSKSKNGRIACLKANRKWLAKTMRNIKNYDKNHSRIEISL